MTNPFSQGYAAIIAALEAWPALTALVRPSNLRNLQQPGYQVRSSNQGGDRPQLLVAERRMNARTLTYDSRNTWFQCSYSIEIASGKPSIDTVNLLTILVLQALTMSGPNLNVPGLIVKWEPIDATAIQADKSSDRPDWTVVLGISVQLALSKADFLAATFS